MARRAASPAYPWIHPDLRQLARPIGELTPHPRNARRHSGRNIAAITESLREHGQVRAAVVTTKPLALAGRARAPAGTVLIGNGMLHAALDLGWSHLACLPFAGSATEARKLVLRDNRTAELGEWEPEALGADLGDLRSLDVDLGLLGWDPGDLVGLLDDAPAGGSGDDPGPQVDRAAEMQAKWGTALGQLWEIPSVATQGRAHRLLCGDSTRAEDVARVMGKERAPLMNTDPPYGIDYSKLKDGIPQSGFRDHQERFGDIENDTLTDGAALQAFLESAIRAALPHLTTAPAFYLWHPMLTQGTFFAAAAAADILIHRQIIWIKPGFVLTRSGQYHWKHELCFYGWIRGKPCPWYGDKSQTSVWDDVNRDADAGMHPTQKPCELFKRPIANHTRPGELVYEPFSGSGSQAVAAEQTGRLCYAIEIDPRYVAVALERLAGMGLKPRLVE